MRISVALAAYCGEAYIAEQILSILPQLSPNDELIISDDSADDKTRRAVLSAAGNDSRIKYFKGPRAGICANFQNALSKVSGDVIFLCDQDDVWCENKVQRVVSEIRGGAELVMHDAFLTDAHLKMRGETFFGAHKIKQGFAANIIRNSFKGCCMAFTKEILSDCLPLPPNIPMHDWFIALLAMKRGRKIGIIDEPLIFHRRHEKSVTVSEKGGTLRQKILWRISLLQALHHSSAVKRG